MRWKVGGFAALVGLSPAIAAAASAATAATSTSATEQVGSSDWAVVGATTATAPYPTGGYTVSFKNSTTVWPYAVNSGTVALTGATYTLSVAGLANGTSVTVSACVNGTWNQNNNTCSGTVTPIVSSSTTPGSPNSVSATGTFPASPAGSVPLRVLYSGSKSSTASATFGAQVARSTQVRAAQTTNS